MEAENKIAICTAEERSFIVDSINKYNLEQVGRTIEKTWIPFEYIVKNKKDEIVGGLLAGLGYWGGLEIRILWIREDQRNKDLGTLLLNRAEEDAKKSGATISILDTFDFQAKDFYLKNGYSIYGELNDFPKDHKRFSLFKKLLEQ